MKTEVVKLSQVALNDENPRTIHEDKFEKLVNSILVLPKMLDLRPVVVDNTMLALGGNMRTRALRAIAKLKISDIKDRLCCMADYLSKTEIEREALIKYWEVWLKKPTVQIVRADQLTEQEKQQFIIKDNVSFGQWDFDKLANSWDESLLGDWGMDVWNMNPMGFGPLEKSVTPATTSTIHSAPDPREDDGAGLNFDNGSLPEELQGVDMNPDNLPKIVGSDETATERIIIVFPKDRKDELQNLLGLTTIDKVVYRLEEIAPSIEDSK